jgi:RHS repeat-associated protein
MGYSPLGELLTSNAHPDNPPSQNQRTNDLKQVYSREQLTLEDQIERIPDSDVIHELATRHYYGADDKLMVVQRYSYRSPSVQDGTWEEYWYDALGRRVLTRARRDPSGIYDGLFSGPLCGNPGSTICRSFIERVWWDGDQSLVEERTPDGTADVSNSGYLGNIHGLGMDQPLAVMNDDATRIVTYNWRGQGESSVLPNGQAGDCSISHGSCSVEIDWPAVSQSQVYYTPGPGSGGSGNPKKWMGTFVANGQGTTGMLYRRNRYFNPGSGQFTQADPVGIAGGMNAFGFVGGDPVNFSDPFGLCPPKDRNSSDCPWMHEEGLQSAGLLDPIAWLSGGIAGGIEFGFAAMGGRAAASAGARVAANKVAGDMFRDEIASAFENNGYKVATEVGKKTPFGRRVIDVEVSKNGEVLGGIEAKAGKSRYLPWQMAKDEYLRRTGYPVQLVRDATAVKLRGIPPQ